MKKTATRLTDERLPLFKLLKWWVDEYGKNGNDDDDLEQFSKDYKYELLDLIEQARAEGKKEGIADGQKKQKKDRFYFGYDKGFVEGKSDLKKRLESILLNPKMVDKIIKGNLMKYDRDIVMKIITLSWEKAIAEAEKGGKR